MKTRAIQRRWSKEVRRWRQYEKRYVRNTCSSMRYLAALNNLYCDYTPITFDPPMTFGEAMVLSVQREVHIRLTDMHSEDALSLIQDAYITSYAVRFDRIRFTAFASVLSGRNVHLHLCGKFEVRQASNGQVVAHARP